MKRIGTYTILAALGLACLTACGTDGTEVETYRDPVTDVCYVEIHRNVRAGADDDSKYAIPCLITNPEKVAS